MVGERVLFDTSLLIAATVKPHPGYEASRAYLARAQAEGAVMCICPQVCREFQVVLTRQPVAGVTFTVEQALETLDLWMGASRFFEETRAVVEVWQDLVRRYAVRGKQVHDCNLVAVMLEHGIKRLATRNAADFARYDDEIAVEPVLP